MIPANCRKLGLRMRYWVLFTPGWELITDAKIHF